MISQIGHAAPATPRPTARTEATAAATKTRQLLGNIMQLAAGYGVNLGGALRFAQRDLAKLDHALASSSSAEQLHLAIQTRNDWMTKGPRVADLLRHGIYQGAKRELHLLASWLGPAGVNSQVLKAFRDGVAQLRQMDAAGLPERGSVGGFNRALDQIRGRIGQAALADVREHPEHVPALWSAMQTPQQTLGKMTRGLQLVWALKNTLLGDETLPVVVG